MLVKISRDTMYGIICYRAALESKDDAEAKSCAAQICQSVYDDANNGPGREYMAKFCQPIEVTLKPEAVELFQVYRKHRAFANSLPNDKAIEAWYHKAREHAVAFVTAFLSQLTYRQEQLIVARYNEARYRWDMQNKALTEAERQEAYDWFQFWNNKTTFLTCLYYGAFEDEKKLLQAAVQAVQ